MVMGTPWQARDVGYLLSVSVALRLNNRLRSRDLLKVKKNSNDKTKTANICFLERRWLFRN